jgi:hypothetical protein
MSFLTHPRPRGTFFLAKPEKRLQKREAERKGEGVRLSRAMSKPNKRYLLLLQKTEEKQSGMV